MKLLMYCTKNKKQLFYDKVKQAFMYGINGKNDKFNSFNGKVVAECDFEVEKIEPQYWNSVINHWFSQELLNKSCLDMWQMREYLNGKDGYAIHINNLKIFDKPLSLFEISKECHYSYKEYLPKYFNAPQNMCYCWYKGEKYCLISIRPEWLVKILNGEKTIEVRKKVLKEMLNDK